MKLVEVIKCEETSQETFDSLFMFANNLRKHPISCKVCLSLINVSRFVVYHRILQDLLLTGCWCRIYVKQLGCWKEVTSQCVC